MRRSYDQVEACAQAILDSFKKECGDTEGYMSMLREIASSTEASTSTQAIACLAQFAVIRLTLNAAERAHADLLLGIDLNDPSVP